MDYQYRVSRKNTLRLQKIVQAYPKDFSHIDPADIIAVVNVDAQTSKTVARADIVPAKLQPILGEKIIIEIWQCQWEGLSTEAKLLVLYHELKHILEFEGNVSYDRKYKKESHDVEEWGTFIEKFGIHWLHSKGLPNVLKEHVKIKRPRRGMATLG